MRENGVEISRGSNGLWGWRCCNANCGWVGIDLGSQQAALREAERHLREAVLQHHGTDNLYPYGGDVDEGRDYTITCWCGREMTGETDGSVETSLDCHIDEMATAAEVTHV